MHCSHAPTQAVTHYRPDIDGLRALAVVSVILFHVGVRPFSGGYVGVDVFFVISGYLITNILYDEMSRTGSFSFEGFYIRRMRRLLPALITTIAVSFFGGYWLLPPLNFSEFGGSAAAALLSVSNFYFLAQVGYFDTAAISKPLLHTWSLSVEDQFYLVWPLIFYVASKRSWHLAFWTSAALGVVSLALGLALFRYNSTVFYMMAFRVFELAAGAVLVWLRPLKMSALLNELGLLIGLAAIVAGAVLQKDTTLFPFSGMLPTVGAALAIIFGRAEVIGLLLRNRLSVGIGVISYSLYLVHWPLIVFYRNYAFGPLDWQQKIGLIFFAAAIAVILHYAIERPFHLQLIKVRRQTFLASCAAAIVALIIASLSVWSSNGWLWRFPQEVADQFSIKDDTFRKYAWEELNRRATSFANNGKLKLLVIGDSQAGDLVNLLMSSGIADKTDLRTIPIRNDCKPIIPNDTAIYYVMLPTHVSECQEQLSALKSNPAINMADTIILAASWVDWAIDRIPETISFLTRNGQKNIFVVGNKMQITTGVQFLATHGLRSNSSEFYDKPTKQTLEANSRIKSLNAQFRFLNPLDLFCSGVECSVVSNTRFLILFDSLHLTPMGVKYLAPRVLQMWGADFINPPQH